jgi:hypothetical protein
VLLRYCTVLPVSLVPCIPLQMSTDELASRFRDSLGVSEVLDFGYGPQ